MTTPAPDPGPDQPRRCRWCGEPDYSDPDRAEWCCNERMYEAHIARYSTALRVMAARLTRERQEATYWEEKYDWLLREVGGVSPG